jgi:hypothetical protein
MGTYSSFTVNDTLVVNSALQANSGGIYFSGTLALNSTAYTGIANNSTYLGAAPASAYVNTTGAFALSGIITHNANLTMGSGVSFISNGSSGSNNALLTSNGTSTYWQVIGSNTDFIYNNSGALTGAVGLTYLSSGNNITATAQHTTDIPLTIAGIASQSANLVQIANSSAIMFAINATGVAVGNGAGLTSIPSGALPADVLYTDKNSQTISGGAYVTSNSLSSGSFTANTGVAPLQYITNSAAFTLTAPANDGSMVLLVTNGSTAGAITFSGFTVGSVTGDALTTTNGNKFMIFIVRINAISTYNVKALQ